MAEHSKAQQIRSGAHVFPRTERLIYGRPAAESVSGAVDAAGWKNAYVLTTRSVVSTPLMAGIGAALGARLAGVFSDITAHSPLDAVLGAVAAARAAGADGLVAVGGGSVIDAAKVVQIGLWHGAFTADALGALAQDNAPAGDARNLRIIAVPTTLSAAEFTDIAGITDTKRGVKTLFGGPDLVPQVVVLDPAATIYTPQRLFLASGIRAVDHCVETLCSSMPTPFGNATAQEGLSLLTTALRAVHADENNLGARLDCQLGAWLAISGPASGVPVGASHAIGRVLGGAFGVPHGETSCILLPGVLRWNMPADHGAQARVVAAMGRDHESASAAVAALVGDLALPGRLSAVGIGPDKFDEIAQKSLAMMKHAMTSGNPRPVAGAQEVKEILALVA